jgi:hypothetical protein
MSSEGWHEPYEQLTPATRDLHRAITTLIEELQAIDWYQQRADVCADDALRAVLVHNKNEEIEHAMMTLEWIRRTSADFDRNVRTYLLQEGPITEIEEAEKSEKSGNAERAAGGGGGSDGATMPSLGVGSLRSATSPASRAQPTERTGRIDRGQEE